MVYGSDITTLEDVLKNDSDYPSCFLRQTTIPASLVPSNSIADASGIGLTARRWKTPGIE